MTFKDAKEYADSINLEFVCVDVLFAAIINHGSLSVKTLFDSLGVEIKQLQMASALFLMKKPQSVQQQTVVRKVFDTAEKFSKLFGQPENKNNLEFLLLAMTDLVDNERPYIYLFLDEELGGEEDSFSERWQEILVSFIRDEPIQNFSFFKNYDALDLLIDNEDAEEDKQDPFEYNPIIEEFATNLNSLAAYGEYDGLVDYDNTLEKLYTTLCREKKKNAIVTGIAGIGKTSCIELLAREIVEGRAPDLLKDKVVYDVHLADMLSGSIWRGQFEAKLTQFIAEVKSKHNVILFFDEIHTLVGAGTGGKSDDLEASNILKPALARGEISCIGATTPSEYDSKIKGNPALERRFQLIRMYPPTSTQMKEILPQLVDHYEQLHPVKYGDEFCEQVISFCDKELPHKAYPDKLVDVIDFCGARAKMDYFVVPDDIREFELTLMEKAKDASEEGELNDDVEKLHHLYREWGLSIKDTKAPVTLDHLHFYLKENIVNLLSKELQHEFVQRLSRKVINKDNVDLFDTALYSVNISAGSEPNIIVVYGNEKVGKSYFLKSAGECLRTCGCEVLNATRFALNPVSLLGNFMDSGKGSFAKKLGYHENPVVIIDDVDRLDKDAADILLDGFKTGRFETIDNEIIPLTNVTFILGANCKSGKVGFAGGDEAPNVSDDIVELAQFVFLEKPTTEHLKTFLACKLEKLIEDLDRQGIKTKGLASALDLNIGTAKGYEDISRIFRQSVIPLAIDGLKKQKKVVDLSQIEATI